MIRAKSKSVHRPGADVSEVGERLFLFVRREVMGIGEVELRDGFALVLGGGWWRGCWLDSRSDRVWHVGGGGD